MKRRAGRGLDHWPLATWCPPGGQILYKFQSLSNCSPVSELQILGSSGLQQGPPKAGQ